MSNRPPTLKDCFKVKKGLCVTGDAYVTGSLTISGDFAWLKPDALLTVGNLATNDLSASRLHSNNVEVFEIPFEPDLTITYPISVVDETIFQRSVVMHDDLWIKGDLRVDGNAYLSAGIGGRIDVGDTNTDSVAFNADIQSHIIPDHNTQYDLGTSEQQWRELYVQDISGTRDLSIDRHVNFSGLSSGDLSGKFVSYQSDGEITTSSLVVDEVNRVTTKVNNTSAEWDSVYSFVNGDSATNNSDYNQTHFVNASGDTMTGKLTVLKDNDVMDLRSVTDSNSIRMTWRTNPLAYNQIGFIEYNHKDSAAYGSGQTFILGGTESSMTVLADGKLMYKEGIYLKPATGTGPGIRKDAEWDSVYTDVSETSAEWDSVYTDVSETSAEWDSVYTDVSQTSAEWDSVYSYVNSESATNSSSYNQTTYVNVTGDTMTGDLTIAGDLTVHGDVTFTLQSSAGETTINLGDSDNDKVVFVGSVSSDIIPSIDSTFSLGAANSAWSDVHTDNLTTNEISVGHVDSDLIPKQNMSKDIGTPGKHWMNIYTHNLSAHGNIYTHALTAHGDITSTGTTSLSTLSLSANSTTPVLRVSQIGTGNALEVVDTTDPDTSPFIIDKKGNVGLGVTSTSLKLDVIGVSRFKRGSSGGQPPIVEIVNTATGTTANPALAVTGDIVATGSISAAGDIYAANHSLVFSDGYPTNDERWSKTNVVTTKRVAGEWDGIHTAGSLTIPVSSYVKGDIKVDGDVTLGQTQSVIILGEIGSDIIPKLDNTYTLGSSDSKFGTGHFDTISTTTLDAGSVSGSTFYFAPSSSEDDINTGGSPSTINTPYSAEREFTYTDVISSRDTSSVVQTNSAIWAEQTAIPEQIHVMTRGSIGLTTQDGEPEYLAIASDNPAGDAIWNDVTYAHAMVVPYNTTVKRIILRAAGSQGADVKMAIHSNEGVTNTNTPEYKYFAETPIETVEQTFSDNNSARVFLFSNTTSAAIGSTIGISVSATQPLNATNVSIVLQYQDPDAP